MDTKLQVFDTQWDEIFKGNKTFHVCAARHNIVIDDIVELERIEHSLLAQHGPDYIKPAPYRTAYGEIPSLLVVVTYVLPEGSYGIEPGAVVIGFRRLGVPG